MDQDRIVAIALLTKTHLEMLSGALPKVYSLGDDDGRFDDLLSSLDETGETHSRGDE